MFDRVPDARLVADLVAAQGGAVELDAGRAAADLIEQLQAWDRVVSWVHSQRLDTMRRFGAARVAADTELADTELAGTGLAGGGPPGGGQPCGGPPGTGDPASMSVSLSVSERAAVRRLRAGLAEQAGRFAAEEIGLAVNISPAAAQQQLALAHDLYGVHRDLGEALELGQVSEFVAAMVARSTRRLPERARRLLDEAVTADAVELPAGKAIAAARARVAQADEYADAAGRRARAERRAFLKPMDDAMAMVGAVLPADDAIRSWTRIDRLARAARKAGDPRNLDQLRADHFTAALTDTQPDTEPATQPATQPGTERANESGADTPAQPAAEREPRPEAGRGADPEAGREADDTPAQRAAGREAGGAPAGGRGLAGGRGGVGKPTVVQVAISLGSLLGLDSRNGWMDGYGSVTPETIRRLLAAGDVTLTRLVCDPVTGVVLHSDPTRYRPSERLVHAVTCRDRCCRMPVCQARIRHLDHLQAAADAGLTTKSNLHGLCERSHLTRHHPGWNVTGDADGAVTWTTPTGHHYTTLPPPATGYGTGPPPEADSVPDLPAWLSHQQRLRAELDSGRAPPHAA